VSDERTASVRACARKGFRAWLGRSGAEIVGLQEVRALPDDLPASLRAPRGWHTDFAPAERRGYSGVGLFARRKPDAVSSALGVPRFDVEGRSAVVAGSAPLSDALVTLAEEADLLVVDAVYGASLEAAREAGIEGIEALEREAGNRSRAARRLGISRQTLHAKIRKHRLADGGHVPCDNAT